MDGKIEIKRDREDFYILEVNDNGDTIKFDLTDLMLPQKIVSASKEILKIDKEYQEETLKIFEDEKLTDEDKIEKALEIEIKKCLKLRKQFDSFLGEGACQKIFGDRNCREMFLEFFDELEPHFKKMEIKQEKAKKRLIEKYLPKKSDVM